MVLYQINRSTESYLSLYKYISCTKGKEQKKGYVKNIAEIKFSVYFSENCEFFPFCLVSTLVTASVWKIISMLSMKPPYFVFKTTS